MLEKPDSHGEGEVISLYQVLETVDQKSFTLLSGEFGLAQDNTENKRRFWQTKRLFKMIPLASA